MSPIQFKNVSLSFREKTCFENFHTSINHGSRIALIGRNGSGKSILDKAFLGDKKVITNGDWYLPKLKEIGYLDQHYSTLSSNQTVLESLAELVSWPHAELRRHLNDFLFRKNEEVHRPISQLSGGEKARLSLAHLAAKTPQLLILDEVTNNLDLEIRQHLINMFKVYPGAMILISHDGDFLNEVGIDETYDVSKWNGQL